MNEIKVKLNRWRALISPIRDNFFHFSILTTFIFFLTFTFLGLTGFMPAGIVSIDSDVLAAETNNTALKEENVEFPVAESKPQLQEQEKPTRIIIKKIAIDSSISNPETGEVSVLDDALKNGVVRHPSSALVGENGNILLLGHSSHLKVVHNGAYRSFNDIEKLVKGDEITIFTDTRVNTYRVTDVSLVKNSEGRVDFIAERPMLTLVTCDNFGAKEDRYVVKAEFIKSVKMVE
ncbi:MAG: hypothetical protein A3G52_01430 [Candidatus Taylorbacteria bacterium RIFCSPLOWO2_12_FULL_43_20]|uniref:Sortase n=1 Tax=Candidatus Taylorbacteria bacterium RIFCSPLOWO2_12_FULL_43_20 TaxID=1802332 RepID=A0A1G2P3R0_9BACT|nr:MAG: hypothetical protein A2825_02900 [Candidatus Taylorbacteria bacterium RIFCSPHIGHO2_01_FULL_43_120]OHA23233.1 MAG: hypothetical protein A3B98_02425 [Candidatus Taylorbacteria bacterium RIFCSPHIGHO2_02_FULL_43_55]OHA29535.1 MAG: hypothetical protein A3E92_01860 [Candidatus Taylorbacteria bacterium RIFCSPHIGHO2_12_FULL_42_34]OHA31339.1 MAG: hypothetical protein A3B09_02295 [Candidatus Taylorbacteria bacterium RIFCSPLOWO2_01_FULL_43_83]OHA38859.1 MAG: hypothetical protein A3H58_00530 [Candi